MTEEKVEGRETVAAVKSRSVFGDDEIVISVVHLGKDGSETPGGARVYKTVSNPHPLFPDAE